MKFLLFTFITVFLVEIHGQRLRTNNQAVATEEPKTIRSRGRARFTNTDVAEQIDLPSRSPSSNRRVSAQSRTDTSSPTTVINRRTRPTETPRGGYAVDEHNNDSPIDSFLRQSKPRVLTESRFEPEPLDTRRPAFFEPSISGTPLESVHKLGFGETARAIVQARGGQLPEKTTTPVVDEQYLLNNFGNTIRTLASASREVTPQRIREDIPIQRATPLRSEVPILDEADIPSRRNVLRGDPLPSLKGSDISLSPTARSRNGGRRTSTREGVERASTSTTTTTEQAIVEDFRRIDPEQDDNSQTVEVLPDLKVIMTEQPQFDIITEPFQFEEEEELTRTSGVEIYTARSSTTLPPPTTKKQSSRRGGSRRESFEEVEYTPRTRSSRPRIKVPEESRQTSRARISRRRYDEVEAAESRRGPSVFTAETGTSRTRTGRRINDSPERYTVDLREITTTRARSLNRRSTIASTESTQDRRSRGRGRLRTSENTSPTTDISVPRGQLKSEETVQNRQRSSKATRFDDSRSSPTRDRSVEPLPKAIRNRGRSTRVDGNDTKPPIARSKLNSRASTPKQSIDETTLHYGIRPRRTESPEKLPASSTKPISRSASRFSDVRIDESRLEVMPLFERESRVIKSRGHRSGSSVDDHMHVSATENDVKFVDKPTSSAVTRKSVRRTESLEESTSRANPVSRSVNDFVDNSPFSSTSGSFSIATKVMGRSLTTTEPTITSKTISSSMSTSRPQTFTKESVVQEVNQVTSKSTITRRKKVSKTRAGEAPSRGSKKAELKLSDLSKKKNSEEVDEEDNYPEPFKAKLKQQKEKQEQSIPSKGIATTTGRTMKASSPAPSSTSRQTTTTANSRGRKDTTSDIINEIENELEPKMKTTITPTSTVRSFRSRKPKVADKPSVQQKKDSLSKLAGITKTSSTKSTLKPRRTYSTKAYSTRSPAERQSRRKALRSTASPPSTTPLSSLNKESKYSAKFVKKVGRDDNSLESPQPTGLYSSKKAEGEEKVARKLEATLIQNAKSVPPIKKFNSSRYSARYRGDTTTRASVLRSTTSAPFYIPTIPTPAYVPTVPTVTPPVSAVSDGIVAVKDDDLGVEVISFDDPVNSIPSSADLVNGEYLTTDKNLKFANMVKGGTTEKPVSIIERIINSITQISTTAAPDTSSSFAATEDQGNSAIQKLANKKTTTKDKTDVQTNIIETITSEKPTTIIEKIRSSLSEIQTKEVGTSSDDNIVSSSSTTPLSIVTKYSAKYRGSSLDSTSLPAPLPLSTSLSPLSIFDEVDKSQVLEKRTIGKLLDILNGLVSTESPQGRAGKLVVVTPKTSIPNSGGFVSTIFTPQEPLEGISLDGITSKSSSDVLDSFENISTSTLIPTDSSFSPFPSTNTIQSTSITSENSGNPLPTTDSDAITGTETPTPPMQNTDTPTTVTSDITATTDIATTPSLVASTTFFPSPFEVSPGSVSIFSANDLYNSVTPDDNLFNTVTIASRLDLDNNVLTSTESTTSVPTTTDVSTDAITTEEASTLATSTVMDTTTVESMTVLTSLSNNSSANSSRSGKILTDDFNELSDNSLDFSTPSTTTSTTPDYFIFAVLNNNTILRKKPPTVPNKEVPFIIVGLLPNNTIIRKFPNGTMVPMDPIIKVRGFDIRPNPPPLVEITSNQVTDLNNGIITLDNNSTTIESSRMARLLENEKTTSSSGTTAGSVTTINSNLSVSTENTTSMPSSSIESTLPIPSSTTPLQPSSTMLASTDTPVATTMQDSTLAPKSVEIMVVPGETRISKSQTTTPTFSRNPATSSSLDANTKFSGTEQASTGTANVNQTVNSTSSEITGSLGLTEILNDKTVDAFNYLVKSDVNSSTQASNYKTLQVNKYNEVLNIQDLINRNNGNIVYRWKPVTHQEYKNIKKTFAITTTSTSTTAASTETTAPFTSILSNEIPDSTDGMQSSTSTSAPTTQKIETTTTTTAIPTTTATTPTTTSTTTTSSTTTTAQTTTRRVEITTEKMTTTTAFSTFTPSTMLPTILTTLFPSLMREAVTKKSTPISSTRRTLTRAQLANNIVDGRFEVLATAGTTAQPTSVAYPSSTARLSTTTPRTTSPTTSITTTEITTQSKTSPILKMISSGGPTPTPSTKEETDKIFEDLKKSGKLKNLNEEQRKNLEEIEKIEKEQAELLRQLSLLTTMFGGQNGRAPNLPPLPPLPSLGTGGSSLANRVIAMAMERDKSRTGKSSNLPTSTTENPTTKRPNSIKDQLPTTEVDDSTRKSTPSLEDVLKQYNIDVLSTPSPLTSTYGKTEEAVLAAILKEHGIGPTTPKDFGEKVKEAGLFDDATTTKKPKPRPRTTTVRPLGGGLMRGLTWLLDILEGPTTRRPSARKSKPTAQTPKPDVQEEELLTNQPTRITPMVTEAPVTKPSLSQEEIKALISQLESVQKNPQTAEQLDFSKIKSLQHLIDMNEGVQVSNSGQHGATSRGNARPSESTFLRQDSFLNEVNRKPKASTISTLSVSNSIDDDVVVSTTVRNRVLPPVSLNPIPGIDDPAGGSMIRSNLLTAAVNVTRAISGFLGSAIQGARRGFRSLLGSGSAMAGDIAHGSVG